MGASHRSAKFDLRPIAEAFARAGELRLEMPKQHGARPADSTGLHGASPSTYRSLGIRHNRAIRMQQAGLVPREDREAYYRAQAESDDFHALIATGHETPRRLARAFCATARV